MNNVKVEKTAFREGDEVVLAAGPHQGTPGVFLRLTHDANWAEIAERNGSIRCHPVEWLAHPTPKEADPSVPGSASTQAAERSRWNRNGRL